MIGKLVRNLIELKEGELGHTKQGQVGYGLGQGQFQLLSSKLAPVVQAPFLANPAVMTANDAAAAVAGKYTLPAGGMPETDMDAAVTAKIDKAHDRQHSITSGSDHTFPGGATTYLDGTGNYSTPATSGSFVPMPMQDVGGTSQAVTMGISYRNTSASLCTFTLPATAAQGLEFEIIGQGTGKWRLNQNSGQSVTVENNTSTVGATGYVTSDQALVAIRFKCVEANTKFRAIAGNTGYATVH